MQAAVAARALDAGFSAAPCPTTDGLASRTFGQRATFTPVRESARKCLALRRWGHPAGSGAYDVTDSNFKHQKREAFQVTSPRLLLVVLRESGASSTLRLLGSIMDVSGILDRPPSRAMTIGGQTQLRDLAAYLFLREVWPESFRLRIIRGRGECRVPNAPAASCALCSWSMHTSIHSGSTGYIRHSPRNGFTAYT